MKRGIFFLLAGLCFIAIGILLWVKTEAFLNVISILFCVYLIVDGVKSFFSVNKVKDYNNTALKVSLIVKGILEILVGILATILVAANWSNNAMIFILAYVIGIDFLVTSIVDFVDWVVLKIHNVKAGGGLLVEAGLGLVFGILFCLFPQQFMHGISTIVGVLIIVAGALTVAYAIHSMVMVNTLKKYGIDLKAGKKQAIADFEDAGKK